MNRSDFEIFTRGAIADLISWAEIYLRTTLPKESVKLVSFESDLATGIDEVVRYLVDAAYESEDSIKPCIDLSVIDFDDTTVTIRYMPSGYSGQPFCLNWAGKAGPYIKMIDTNLLRNRSNKDFPKEWKLNT